MESEFHPWKEWLGVNKDLETLDFYTLVGLAPFESDVGTIQRAVDQVTARLRSIRPGTYAAQWMALLDMLRTIRGVLTEPDRKAKYDTLLRMRPSEAAISRVWAACARKATAGTSAESTRAGGFEHSVQRLNSTQRRGPIPRSDSATHGGTARDKEVDTELAMAPFVPDGSATGPDADPMAPPPWLTATDPYGVLAAEGYLGSNSPAAYSGWAQVGSSTVPEPMAASASAIPAANPPCGSTSGMGTVIVPGAVTQGTGVPTTVAVHGQPSAPQVEVASGSPAPVIRPLPKRTLWRRSNGPTVAVFFGGVVAGVALLVVVLMLTGYLGGPMAKQVAQTDHSRKLVAGEDHVNGRPEPSSQRSAQGVQVPTGSKDASDSETDLADRKTGASPPERHVGNGSSDASTYPSRAEMPGPNAVAGADASRDNRPSPVSPLPNTPPAMPSTETTDGSSSPPAPPMPTSVPLTAEEKAALADALAAAREALLQRDVASARQWLAKAEPLARTDEHRGMLNRLQLLATYLEEYQQAVQRALQKLSAGDNVAISETTVIAIVERKPQELTVRVAGRNVTYPLHELPLRLGLALVDQGMEAGPRAQAVKAAFQYTHPRSTPELKQEALTWWLQASEGGEPTAELSRIFDDDYASIRQ